MSAVTLAVRNTASGVIQTVGMKWLVLLSQEYCTAGKSSQLIRFENQKELLYKYILNFIILLLIVVVVVLKLIFTLLVLNNNKY